jgi:XTP/dITP diphosphohydrolase
MPARRFTGGNLVIASHNKGKVREIGELLAQPGIAVPVQVISAGELGLPEPDETGTTYIENAVLKARAAASAAKLPALADDSGFDVRAIGGQPGIYAARWAGPSKDFDLAMQKVWDAMQQSGSDDRHAEFVCALALAWPDGHVDAFEGRIAGGIVWPPRGDRGFGYDPMFVPDGQALSYGEMDSEWKHADSHRARAFRQLVAACFG